MFFVPFNSYYSLPIDIFSFLRNQIYGGGRNNIRLQQILFSVLGKTWGNHSGKCCAARQ